jgi:hypothetical protein
MPDLKSEMSKVINQWNDPVPTPTTITPTSGRAVTTNSTRTTFNYVRDNPGVTRGEAVVALEKLGVPSGSSTSLISVMVGRGNLRKAADGGLFAVQKEYAPITPPTQAKAVKTPAPAPKPEVIETPTEWTVESVIGGLNVRQALAVYDELRKIFGA